MIIQMNATVCAVADHGGGVRHKIPGGDWCKRAKGGLEDVSDQEKQEIRAWCRSAGSSDGDVRQHCEYHCSGLMKTTAVMGGAPWVLQVPRSAIPLVGHVAMAAGTSRIHKQDPQAV
jgi:hypothetical protein